jgi:hypothetical protein
VPIYPHDQKISAQPYRPCKIDGVTKAISRFDRWWLSATAMFQQASKNCAGFCLKHRLPPKRIDKRLILKALGENSMKKYLMTTFMSATMLLTSSAQAMDIKDYFKMANQDQGRFDNALFVGAEKVLRDEGRTDLAEKLDKLFTEVKAGNKLSDGMADYEANLGAMVIAEVKREARNPNLPHLQAERAFRDAAQDHGIPLPPAFDTVASNFHPQFPPKKLVNKKDDKN